MNPAAKSLIALFTLIVSCNSVCQEKVIWVTPLWDSYTNPDGTGLYNDIVRSIFEDAGFSVEQITRSWKKSLTMVQNAEADITGAEDFSPKYNQSKYPILFSSENILFKKKPWGDWQGIQSLQDKMGVWYEGYAVVKQDTLSDILKGSEVQSRRQALEIFLNGKRNIDYYFDNRFQMLQIMEKADVDLGRFGLEMREISQSSLHMVFQKTTRGNRLRTIFDAGLERMHCSGELLKIYTKWQQQMPAMENNCSAK